MLQLYIIRHGQTDYNVRNVVQGGGINSSLNEEGQNQARKLFEKYKHIDFKAVVHTALLRTNQTVAPFKIKNIPFIEIPELNEISWGIIEGKETTREVMEQFHLITTGWSDGKFDMKIEGGESAMECWTRVQKGLNKIIALFPEGGKVLVCIHGRILRVLLSQITGYGLRLMNIFPHENTAMNIIHFAPSGKCRIQTLNDTSHLN